MISTFIKLYKENYNNISVFVMGWALMTAIICMVNHLYLHALTCTLCFFAVFCPAFGITYPALKKKYNKHEVNRND